jgi:acyl-CoA-binding protein
MPWPWEWNPEMEGCWCFETVTDQEMRSATTQEFLDNMNYGMTHLEEMEHLSNEAKLELYSLGMQGWFGNQILDRPKGVFDFVGKAQWDAYEQKRGMARIDAQE